jgi:cobalt/nickel transport system permease protein
LLLPGKHRMTLNLKHFPSSDSLLGKVDPRWKLAALILMALAVSLLHNLPAAAVGLATALALVAIGRLPLRWYVARLGALALLMVWFAVVLPFVLPDQKPGIAIGTFHIPRGLAVALLLCLKAFAIVTFVMVQLATTPLTATLKAAHALHMPGLIVQVAMLAYRYLFVMGAEFVRLRNALRVRGYRSRASRHCYRTIGQVSGTLLVKGYERAERVGQAMRCRGFDGRFRALNEFRTEPSDIVFFMLLVVCAAGLVIWDFAHR